MSRHAASNPVCRAMSTGRGRLPCKVPAPATAVQGLLLVTLATLVALLPTPSSAQDSWTPTSTTGAPTARESHTAVWSGAQMIVWGGYDVSPGDVNTGGVYDPAADTWTTTSTTGAPAGRASHTAVWTGSTMIIWGGWGPEPFDTGGIYDPATDTWTATSVAGAPSARVWHTAVWTGSKMIIWGGMNLSTHTYYNTGGIYDPATDTWTAVSTLGAPAARRFHSAIWTGSRMIVWGGVGDTGMVSTGGIYDPATNIWASTSTTGAPIRRISHTAVWTGSRMIIWSGLEYFSTPIATGGIYDPATDTWAPTSTSGAPVSRRDHRAVWTGSRMVIWGGSDGSMAPSYDTGGIYDPATDRWTATLTANVPTARTDHTMIWTGSRMIVWGGSDLSPWVLFNTGGIYDDRRVSPSPTDFYTVTPCRVVDTRDADGPILGGKTTRSFPVTGGVCGIPSTAIAVSVNLTAVGAAAAGYLTLFAGDGSMPLPGSIYFTPGMTRANNAIVLLARDGSGTISVYDGSTRAVHFVLDVNGYFQ